jgi:flagellar biosynthesis protein FlhB
VGALAQTGFRLRAVGAAPWRVRVPGAADAGGAFARMAWAFAVMIAAGGAVALGWQRIAAIPALPLAAGLDAAAAVALDAVLAALGACAALAIADVAIARWRWERATMMTAAEAREEHRGADCDPETKQRRRHAARRIAGTVRGKELRGKAA